MNLRLFIALEPPEPVRRRLASMQERLKTAAGRHSGEVKWVRVDNVHLTLQFLGAVPDDRVEVVKTAIAAAAASTPPLHLELLGVGGFPNARRPRVLWVGIGGDVAPLTALVASLGRALEPLGFPPEDRPFSPHLTLGRSRDSRGAPGLGAALAQTTAGPGASWRTGEIVLFQSHLSPSGPRYEPLARLALGQATGAGASQ